MKLPRFNLRDLFWLVLVAIGSACNATIAADDAARTRVLESEDLQLRIDPEEPFNLSSVPKELRELDGKRVEIRGYMYAGSVFSLHGIERFALTVETKGKQTALGFGGFPPLKSVVVVETRPNQPASFTRGPISVRGVFRVRPSASDGTLYSVFALEDAEIKSVAPRAGFHNSVDGGC